SSRRRHTRFSRDWSSDVCSSDLHTLSRYYYPPMDRYNCHCVVCVAYRVHPPAQSLARHSARSHLHKIGCAYIHFAYVEIHKSVSQQIHGVPPTLLFHHCPANAAWQPPVLLQTVRIFLSDWQYRERFWILWPESY